MIRIVAGEAKGRQIKVPKSLNIRPTTDRCREAIFNSLNRFQFPYGKRVLDLFAGSGALGLESLSRGAEFVTFVDHSKDALKCINENLIKLDYKDRAELIRFDSLKYVSSNPTNYDLVFLDPPYKFDDWTSLFELLEKCGILAIESNREVDVPIGVWEVAKTGQYSNTYIKVCINTQL